MSDLRAELEATIYGWRGIADSDKTSVFAAGAYRACADELELIVSRHADTLPAPPPESTRETQPTIPDGRGA